MNWLFNYALSCNNLKSKVRILYMKDGQEDFYEEY